MYGRLWGRAVSEAEGDADGTGEAAAPAADMGHGPGGEVALVGPDKKKKKKNRRGSQAGASHIDGKRLRDGDMVSPGLHP